MKEARTLDPNASGLRHLRWGREILATIEAHYEHDPHVSQDDRDFLLTEAVAMRRVINTLSAAVKAYRDFLERDRTRFRGMVRVGDHLVATARSADETADAAAIAAGFAEILGHVEVRDRAPKRAAVRDAVASLRAEVERACARVEGVLGGALAESLLPALTADRSRVADDGDHDDDAAGRDA